MLPVFVVNLSTSTERWSKTHSRLNELGVDHQRFDAVDGRGNPHPLFERYDDNEREKYRRKPLSGGELGCFASHFTLWEKCIEMNESIVVLEDDLKINDTLPEALNIAEKHIGQVRYLRLAGTYPKAKDLKKISMIGSFSLIDHIRGPCGTLGYAISPSAAKSLIEHADKWFIAVDDYMDRYWWHGVDCYSLMPFPIDVAQSESDIVRIQKTPQPLWKKLRKEFYGAKQNLIRYVYRINKLCKDSKLKIYKM